MSSIQTVSTANSFESLLEEIIAKACLKGAKISSWHRSPNGRTVIEISGKLPVFYLSMRAAADSLIYQFNLISQYRHLYQNTTQQLKQIQPETSSKENKISPTTKAIYECDAILANMDNELTASTKRKLYETMGKINATQHMNPSEFYLFQNVLVEHFRNKVIEARSTKKKNSFKCLLIF